MLGYAMIIIIAIRNVQCVYGRYETKLRWNMRQNNANVVSQFICRGAQGSIAVATNDASEKTD